MKKEIKKECGNCRYYSQHYSKQGTKFDIVFCGHCTNPQKKVKNRFKPELCENWDDISVKKQERKLTIFETLSTMSKHLDEILNVLKDDNKISH